VFHFIARMFTALLQLLQAACVVASLPVHRQHIAIFLHGEACPVLYYTDGQIIILHLHPASEYSPPKIWPEPPGHYFTAKQRTVCGEL